MSTAPRRSISPRPRDDDRVDLDALRRWLPRRLWAWFERCRRDLPWRKDRDPYRIWVSEVMLQQTQVATVVPYFERFLTALPTLAALAEADEHDVLRLWEGLGYYRRARALHRAARLIVAQHDGRFPNDPDILAALPGIGRYTCNAVLSQAFDRRLPILEANTLRLLSRLLGQRENPRKGRANRQLWQAAEALLPSRRVGEFNQALMELGALVCSPVAPRCAECPVAARCVAKAKGLQDVIPRRAPTPATVTIREAAVVLRRGGKVLLVQRPTDADRWAGLWEFPHGPLRDDESFADGARRICRELTGMVATITGELLTLRHGVTRHAITLVAFQADAGTGRCAAAFHAAHRWLEPAAITAFPVSAPQRRLADALNSAAQLPRRQRRASSRDTSRVIR